MWSRPDQTNGRTNGLVGATQRSDHLAAESEPYITSIGLRALSVRAYSRLERRTHTQTLHLGALAGGQSRRRTHGRAAGRARSTSSPQPPPPPPSSYPLLGGISWVCAPADSTVSLPPRAHTQKVTQSDDANNAAPQDISALPARSLARSPPSCRGAVWSWSAMWQHALARRANWREMPRLAS